MHMKHSTKACATMAVSVEANAMATPYRDNSSCNVNIYALPAVVIGRDLRCLNRFYEMLWSRLKCITLVVLFFCPTCFSDKRYII